MKRPSGKCVVSVFLVSKSVGMIPNECAKQCKIMKTNNRNDRRSSILVPHIFLKFGCHYGYVYCTLKSVEPALVVADVLVPEWRNDVRMASVRSVAIESFVDRTQRVYQRLVFVFTQVLLHERKKKLLPKVLVVEPGGWLLSSKPSTKARGLGLGLELVHDRGP